MTHQDKGKYFKKHPEQTKISEDLKREILGQTKDNNISCKAAEKISREKNVIMSEIGVAVDMLNINIAQCQLGLFGYDGKKKLVTAADSISPELESDIKAVLVDNRLPCTAAWGIADKLKIKRLDVCAACEKLKIKIKPCQLGAF
jgi:signal recognition particle receptor subunit beta